MNDIYFQGVPVFVVETRPAGDTIRKTNYRAIADTEGEDLSPTKCPIFCRYDPVISTTRPGT